MIRAKKAECAEFLEKAIVFIVFHRDLCVLNFSQRPQRRDVVSSGIRIAWTTNHKCCKSVGALIWSILNPPSTRYFYFLHSNISE